MWHHLRDAMAWWSMMKRVCKYFTSSGNICPAVDVSNQLPRFGSLETGWCQTIALTNTDRPFDPQ